MEWEVLIILLCVFIYIVFILRWICNIILSYDNCNPVKTIGWILAVLFVPVLGVLFYIVTGRNLNKKRKYYRKLGEQTRKYGVPPCGFDTTIKKDALNGCTQLVRLLSSLNHLPVFPGSKVDFFTSGKEKFERMFEDIRNARDHIHIFYYTIGDDKIGTAFKDLLIEKSRQGIDVKLMYDDVGCNQTNKEYFGDLKNAGVETGVFFPVRFPRLLKSINYRNHKKVVVIDGKIGYTGGMNVKDEYIEGLEWGPWRDIHLRIEGSGAQGLQTVFIRDWFYIKNEYLNDRRYYPPVEVKENNAMQVMNAEPFSEYDNIMQGMVSAISRAKKSVYIESPYFVPADSLLMAIQCAGLSGLDVHLVIPGQSDSKMVQHASNSYISQLLTSNIKVYRYNAGFLHSKIMVIDEEITIAGSSNLDIRSFELNFEANVFIYSPGIARRALDIIRSDIGNSKLLDIHEWNNRSWKKRFKESFFRLFSPLM